MARTLIRTNQLRKSYKKGTAGVRSLDGISIEFNEGDFVAVMGPSGSGKTTLINIFGLLDRPTSGSYFFDGVDTRVLDHDQMAFVRNKHIGFVFQNFNLLTRHTALENVELPLIYSGVAGHERQRRASSALKEVGLGCRLNHLPHQLSGGEQQRVAIARALVIDPALILADEPTGALDSQTGLDLIQQLQRLNCAGRTIVMVTHNADIARYARRWVELADGQISSDSGRLPVTVESVLTGVA